MRSMRRRVACWRRAPSQGGAATRMGKFGAASWREYGFERQRMFSAVRGLDLTAAIVAATASGARSVGEGIGRGDRSGQAHGRYVSVRPERDAKSEPGGGRPEKRRIAKAGIGRNGAEEIRRKRELAPNSSRVASASPFSDGRARRGDGPIEDAGDQVGKKVPRGKCAAPRVVSTSAPTFRPKPECLLRAMACP